MSNTDQETLELIGQILMGLRELGMGSSTIFLIIGNIKMHPHNALDFKWVCDTRPSDFRIPTDLLSLFRLSLFEYISESHISTALSSDFCVGHNELKYLANANWISKCHELVPVGGHCLSVMPQVDWALLSLDVYPDGKTAGWSLCWWDGFIQSSWHNWNTESCLTEQVENYFGRVFKNRADIELISSILFLQQREYCVYI